MTRDEVAAVLTEVHRLPTMTQMVIRLRYGLMTGECLTPRQVSEHIGLPSHEVRRVERRGLERIAEKAL